MTLQEAINKLLNVARAELEYHEGYNNYIKYAEGNWDNQFYSWDLQNQPWCDVFCDWCYCQAFGLQTGAAMTYQTVGKGSALCSASASFYQKNNAFYNYPQPGDQVFFYSNGAINHTGLVESINGSEENWNSFTTIEGNTNDQVNRHTYKRGDSRIAGFGRPKWSLVVSNTNKPTNQTNESSSTNTSQNIVEKYHDYIYNVKVNLLKEGDSGAQVLSLQALLKTKGFNCAVNGIFDTKTVEALKSFQIQSNLSVDGEFGGETFNALWNYF